uniref:Putative AP-1 complex subunit gamma-2-like n=1 Tax=Davidia involucrata TaxID=16924 RepID=A0A5B6Z1G0_DAVIN
MRQLTAEGGLVLCPQLFQLHLGLHLIFQMEWPNLLLDLSSDDAPAPSSSGGDFLQDLLGVDLSLASSQSGTSQAEKSGTDVLLDLLSIGTPPAQNSSSTTNILSFSQDNKTSVGKLERLSSPSAQASSPAGGSPVMDLLDGFAPNPPMPEDNGPAYPSIVAFESSSLRITFNISKPPENPQTTLLQATFTNKSPNVYTDFIFQAAVPKFLQLHLDPASGNALPASGDGPITQNFRVTNSQHGKKSIVMRIRIAYKMNNKDILEEGQINNFPRGL